MNSKFWILWYFFGIFSKYENSYGPYFWCAFRINTKFPKNTEFFDPDFWLQVTFLYTQGNKVNIFLINILMIVKKNVFNLLINIIEKKIKLS